MGIKKTVWLKRSDGELFHVEVGSVAESNLRSQGAQVAEAPKPPKEELPKPEKNEKPK